MRLIELKNGGEIWQFDSVAEVTGFSAAAKFMSLSEGFVGEDLQSWDAVQKRTERDWAEGMYTLNQFVERLRKMEIPEIKSHKRKVQFNDHEGDEVDYDRLYSGQAFYRKSERESVEGSTIVTVVIDTTTPAHKDSTNILWRGAAAIALTEILEEKGYSVNLWVVNGTELYEGSSRPIMTACCLKRCSDPLDSSTLINTVAGWFYRTVTFTLLFTICGKQGKKPAMGLGKCHTPSQDELDYITPDELRMYLAGVFSFDGTISAIRHELNRINEHNHS